MSGPVIKLFPGGVVTREQVDAMQAFEGEVETALTTAKTAGVPQGFLVALLHAFANRETSELL